MELDVTKKVRTAIKAKLLELGVHVDDELPDYIMILIANRRTKVQMEEDLGLFLGDNTMKFSNWLHQVLKKLEEVTTGGGTVGGEKPVPSSSTSTTSVAAVKKSVDVTSTSSSVVSKEKDVIDKKQVIQPTSSSVKVKDSKVVDLPSSNKKRKSDVSKDESDVDETASKSPSSKKLKISRKKVDSVQQSNSDHEKSASAVVSSSSKRSPVVDRSKSRSKSPPPSSPSPPSNLKSRTRSRSPIKFNRLESSVVVTAKSDKLPKIASVLSKKPPQSIKLRSRSPVTGPRRSPIRAAAPSRRSDRDRDRDRDRSFSPPTSSSLGQRKRHHGGLELPSRSTHRGSLLSRIRRSRTRSRSRSGSPTSKARNTLRSLVAVVKRERHGDSTNAAKDEEYNPLRPEVGSSSSAGELSGSGGVASVVHVTPRPKRATKQEERGSNKLLFRALADAQKSIVSHSMSTSKAVTSASADSKDKDKEAPTPSDKSDIRKERDAHLSSQNQQQSRASLPRRSHQQNVHDARDRDRDRESRRLKKPEGSSSKPSVKDRLGFRLGKKVDNSRDDNVSSSFRDYSDDEDDLRDGDFIEGSEDYKTIKISVPTSKTAKERNVTLEYAEEKAASSRQTSSSKPAPVSYEEPKRLSIQVNVDSDTSSSEDELEIQPRTTEDLDLDRLNDDRDDSSETSKKNLKPNSNAKISIEDKLKGRLERKPRSKNGSSSDEPKKSCNKSNETAKNSVVDSKVSQAKKADSSASASDSEEAEPDQQDKKEGDKGEERESDESQKKIEPTEEIEDADDDGTGSEASVNKAEGPRTDSRSDEDVEADETRGSDDDDHEEIEIEEYEEIEEEEDDEEYDVVIQERNISLPDPDGYEGKKSTTETMDVGGEASTSAGGGHMDVSDGHDNERKSEESMYLPNSSHQHHPDSIQMGEGNGMVMVTSGGGRYPLHLRTDNHSAYDTRFVVTMEGAEDMDSMTYYEEESMDTEAGGSYSQPSMDLRQRITRSFAQNQSLESIINAKSVRPVGSFHHQGGRGVYDGSRKSGNSRSYLPITGGHIRPPPPVQIHNHAQSSSVSSSALLSGSGSNNVIGSGGGGSGGPSCKYWPDCSFKDKCIYPHPPCKFGDKCTKPECPYKHELFHQSEVGGGGSGSGKIGGGVSSGGGPNGGSSGGIENDGKVICKFFPKCHSMSCQFYHPSPCRFGVGCTDVKCKNYHPGVTVAEQRSKNKLFGSVTRSSSYNRAIPPAAHLLRWKAPSVGSSVASGGGTPADSSLDSVSVSADNMKSSDLLAAPVPTTSTA